MKFDDALALMATWVGYPVRINVEDGPSLSHLATLQGTLQAPQIDDAATKDEIVTFQVGDDNRGKFTLDRVGFRDAEGDGYQYLELTVGVSIVEIYCWFDNSPAR